MSEQAITPKRRVSQAPIKLIACFGGCGATVERRTTPRVYCQPCKYARKLASARVAMEKQRRKRGVPLVKGTTARCHRCGALFERTRNVKAKFCGACTPAVLLDSARERGRRMNRIKGCEEIGTLKRCTHCGVEFVKAKKGRQIYCLDCMALSKASKLPSSRAAINAWRKKRIATDPAFALNGVMRSGIRNSLDAGAKAGRAWESLVGYTVEQLKRHLERQFTPRMSWTNRGTYWQIDHVLPLSGFSFDNAESPEFVRAWSLPNLRPLPKTENYEKRAKRTHLL